MTDRSDLKTVVERILSESRWRRNPYFEALREKRFDKADFVETQIQFYFAVIFFSRPMAALAARIPTAELRVEVLRNVWEEHGEGNLGLTHGSTFRELLSRLAGITEEQIEERALWPEVRVFNTALAGCCVLDEYLISCGAMGMVERMFSEISGWIGRGIVEAGWLPPGQMIHYDLHERLDVRHSDDLFDVLAVPWRAGGAEARYYVEQGLRMGATLFDGLYEGLWRSRARRLRCEVPDRRTRP